MHHGKVVIHLFVFQLRVKSYQVEGSDLFMHWVYLQRYSEQYNPLALTRHNEIK